MDVAILEGERILLRPPRPSDAEERRSLGLSPEIMRGYGVELREWREMTAEQAQRFYDNIVTDDYRWIIEVAGRLIGTLGIHHVDEYDRRAMLRIGMADQTMLDRGYGTEAVMLAARFAFEEAGLHRLSLRVLATNQRAIRCYEKCGFKHEGRERESARVSGGWEDDVLMGLLPGDLDEALRRSEQRS